MIVHPLPTRSTVCNKRFLFGIIDKLIRVVICIASMQRVTSNQEEHVLYIFYTTFFMWFELLGKCKTFYYKKPICDKEMVQEDDISRIKIDIYDIHC